MSDAVANVVKRILESETGDTFDLKSGISLLHKDRWDWFLHLPWGNKANGWVDVVYEKNGTVFLETPFLFDVRRRIVYAYRKFLGRKWTERDLNDFHNKDVRTRHAKEVPAIVAFFDELERTIDKVNVNHSTRLEVANDSGAIRVFAELPEKEAQESEKLRKTVVAIKELDSSIINWLREEYPKMADGSR